MPAKHIPVISGDKATQPQGHGRGHYGSGKDLKLRMCVTFFKSSTRKKEWHVLRTYIGQFVVRGIM